MSLLEQHFDVAFAAPDGIKKLRELILTLAMQGKLVPQDPNDEPANELLKSIEVEKNRLVKEEGLRTSANQKIEAKEQYFGNPSGWEYCRLGNLSRFIDYRGKTPKKVDSGIPLITAKNVRFGYINREPYEYVTEAEYKSWMTRGFPKVGDLLFTTEAPLGNIAIIDIKEPFALAQRVICLQLHNPEIADFLKWLIMSVSFQKCLLDNATGMTATGIKSANLKEILIPLPPLAEQRRIVAKIDQLMARCDELEKLRLDRSQRLLTVHTAALDRLLTAKDSSEFSTAWSFITQHFGELYSVKENVVELRKTILQLAVMGKLVRQDPNDEPASELLRSIELEKQRLVKEGKIKKSKPFSDIKPEEVPYELPNGWKWVRLGCVGAFERGKSKHRPRNDKRLFADGIYPFVQTGDVSKSKFTNNQITSCRSYYNDFGLQQSRLWLKGTLCITIAANIAETGFLGMEACIPDSVVAFVSTYESLSKLVKVFIDVAKEDLEHFAPSTAQKNINLEIINDLIFPLPPLAEQGRIVEKIDRLMGMCDRLEESIESSKVKQTDLLNALMSQV